MVSGFKFKGEFLDADGKRCWRECVVAISDKTVADLVGRQKLVGARVMLSIALSAADLANMGLKEGDIRMPKRCVGDTSK